MSNLGGYQQIVQDAKRAGGVDELIKTISTSAVFDAAPKLIAAGVGIRVEGTLAFEKGKQYVAARRQAGKDAADTLREAITSGGAGDVDKPTPEPSR